jgi:hypothetical protein
MGHTLRIIDTLVQKTLRAACWLCLSVASLTPFRYHVSPGLMVNTNVYEYAQRKRFLDAAPPAVTHERAGGEISASCARPLMSHLQVAAIRRACGPVANV